MLYKTSDPKTVAKEIKKLKPIPYNKFMWWRRFESKTKPLPKGATFLQRIKNNEFEFSHFYWQWKLTELEINELYTQYKGNIKMLLEKNKIDLERRKRLILDFEKDENDRLEALKNGFLREFFMTEEDYYDHLEKFDGTTEDFYFYCSETFGKTFRPIERRGRPKKIKDE
jgi:hypothetical protein